MNRAEELLKELEDFAKWGQLANKNTMSIPDVKILVEFLRDDDAQDTAQSDEIRHLTEALAKERGQRGGLTKQINKLKKSLDDQDKLKANNRKLSRIATAAHALVDHKDVAAHRCDDDNELLLMHPLYVALREECR